MILHVCDDAVSASGWGGSATGGRKLPGSGIRGQRIALKHSNLLFLPAFLGDRLPDFCYEDGL